MSEKMSNYLYNGIELPELPDWDKEAYPYATIRYVTGIFVDEKYELTVSKEPLYITFEPSTYALKGSGDMRSSSLPIDGSAWGEFGIVFSGISQFLGDGTWDKWLWTNYDIELDGEVFSSASEPVPVDPDDPLYRDNATITLGSGTLYLTEYDGETLPDVETVCVEENRMGYTKGGAALQYTEETTEEKDDLGLAYKIITTKTDVVLKCGLITWNGETLLKLIDRCTTVIQDGKRVVKIGGRGNAKGAKYVIVFHHEDPIDGDLWALIVGRNTAGLTVTCTTEAGALLEPEFRAAPHDTEGTLVRLIEGSRGGAA